MKVCNDSTWSSQRASTKIGNPFRSAKGLEFRSSPSIARYNGYVPPVAADFRDGTLTAKDCAPSRGASSGFAKAPVGKRRPRPGATVSIHGEAQADDTSWEDYDVSDEETDGGLHVDVSA